MNRLIHNIGWTLQNYLDTESRHKRKLPLEKCECKIIDVEEIPKQKPGSGDCGLFFLKYADLISKKDPIKFDSDKYE